MFYTEEDEIPENAELLRAPEVNQTLSRIDRIRLVLKNHAFAKIEGFLVDMQTANVVCMVYDALKPENQATLLRMSLPRMVDVCWKLCK